MPDHKSNLRSMDSAAAASEQVDFGLEKVSPDDKTARVRGVFESVAERYDVMNDLMSLGSHRIMKRMAVEMSGVRPGQRVLDLAGGTGDLTALYARVVGTNGQVVLGDINGPMMRVGRDRLLDDALTQITYCQTAAEQLPFGTHSFHCVSIGFGLRNFTDKDAALRQIARVLVPGGVLLVLEFSRPENPLLAAAYETYQALWPGVGHLVTGNGPSYKYLVDSIRVHPPQRALKVMMEDAGFASVEYENLLGGIAAIHRATTADPP